MCMLPVSVGVDAFSVLLYFIGFLLYKNCENVVIAFCCCRRHVFGICINIVHTNGKVFTAMTATKITIAAKSVYAVRGGGGVGRHCQ